MLLLLLLLLLRPRLLLVLLVLLLLLLLFLLLLSRIPLCPSLPPLFLLLLLLLLLVPPRLPPKCHLPSSAPVRAWGARGLRGVSIAPPSISRSDRMGGFPRFPGLSDAWPPMPPMRDSGRRAYSPLPWLPPPPQPPPPGIENLFPMYSRGMRAGGRRSRSGTPQGRRRRERRERRERGRRGGEKMVENLPTVFVGNIPRYVGPCRPCAI